MPYNLNVTLTGDLTSDQSLALQNALEVANNMQSKLPLEILSMHGMSGKKYRSLINTLVEKTPDARYLEVGSWAGSTACSAMYGNTCTVKCIDNWSQFLKWGKIQSDGGPKEVFLEKTNLYKNENINFSFIEQDFRKVDFSSIGKFNIYLFDGPHEEADQYDGISMALPALDDTFILIVDDWNWPGPRDGTLKALASLGMRILTKLEVRTTDDNSHGPNGGEDGDWHNGYFIAVISKK